jgi:hypothetical protein
MTFTCRTNGYPFPRFVLRCFTVDTGRALFLLRVGFTPSPEQEVVPLTGYTPLDCLVELGIYAGAASWIPLRIRYSIEQLPLDFFRGQTLKRASQQHTVHRLQKRLESMGEHCVLPARSLRSCRGDVSVADVLDL